ncbi:dynamin family protein [Nannocystis pusilla]|uniref:Dynamin family protein n=1 Tax=Nannocystis pusilla TaxID=889268 RepID=A0A9X3J1J3_9BACT|nr:dynamin family protein [Nannocystis pusilla]MCY1011185.1 dynamin family protein [Nannocystis pusilla]
MSSDDTRKPKDEDKNPLRSMGSALGGWAKRMGTILSEVTQQGPPEEVARAISQARELSLTGDYAGAATRLREPLMQRPGDAHLKLALAITRVAQVLTGNAHLSVLLELAEPPNKRGERALPETLAEATRLLLRDEFDPALDQLRRGRKLVEDAAEPALHDARFLLNLLTTLLQVRRGRFERGLLEFQRARARLPEGTRGPLRALLIREGAQLLLAEDHLDEAIAWLTGEADLGNTAAEVEQGTAAARLPLGGPRGQGRSRRRRGRAREAPRSPRVGGAPRPHSPAPRDRVRGARARPPPPPARPAEPAAQAVVGPVRGRGLARRRLRREPLDPRERARRPRRRRRLGCRRAAGAAPPGAGPRRPAGRSPVRWDSRADPPAPAGRGRICPRGAAARQRPPAPARQRRARRRRLPPRSAAALPQSARPRRSVRPRRDLPLRDASQRLGVLRGQRALASAEFCLKSHVPGDSQPVNLHEAAQEYLVEVLTESPEHTRARALLAQLAQPLQSNRLEDLLAAATALLAAIPSRVLGVPITGVADALSGVIAARERLARPLTIAVMGEFSSGKSTFVNALLGEVVAPMGVLPTTTTINFFRRGPTGGARVHYRDGSISTVARGEVHTFLRGLDDVAASRVRHMEIERTSARMGEAAVVDTPGLNALDGFHERVAREFVDEADAIIWIFSATRGGAASEAGVLKSMRADGRQVLGVLNKVDTLDPEERAELTDYLKQQFGDVLLDIIPVCASDALELRTGSADPEARHDDPFRAVEDALEKHFLAHARELKRSLAARRLGDALARTGAAVREAIAGLEIRASQTGPVGSDPTHLEARLVALGDKVYGQLLALDDLLTRECLALGVLRAGAGGKILVTEQDVTYLTAVLRDSILRALQADLGELSQEPDSDAFSDILAARLVPWAQGYLDSLESSGFIASLIHEHGHGVAKGEAALRERYRSALAPVAASWRKFIRGQVRAIRQSIAQMQHRTASAPSAEALRLRATTLAGVDALLSGLEQVAP